MLLSKFLTLSILACASFHGVCGQRVSCMSQGSWFYPLPCQGSSCQYRMWWEVTEGDMVRVTVAAKQATNKWTGIGLTYNSQMSNSDVILGYLVPGGDGQINIEDRYATSYSEPGRDGSQDVQQTEAGYVDGTLVLRFSRKIHTGDGSDIPFGPVGRICPRLMFPVGGGAVENVFGRNALRVHSVDPIISPPVCIC